MMDVMCLVQHQARSNTRNYTQVNIQVNLVAILLHVLCFVSSTPINSCPYKVQN